jgi:hypothetical protein
MAEDASNAATPIAAKIAFGLVLMFKSHSARVPSGALNKPEVDG